MILGVNDKTIETMKNNICKILLLFAAAPFIMPGCGGLAGEESEEPSGETVTLRLKNAAAEPDVKTSIDQGGQVSWNYGDVVYINGEPFDVIPDESAPGYATVEGVPVRAEYLASYPDPLSETSDGYYGVMIPSIQSYNADEYLGTYGISANPMIAYGTTEELSFFNIGAVLCIGIFGDSAVTGISLTSNDGNPMAGQVRVPMQEVIDGFYSDRYMLWPAEQIRVYHDCWCKLSPDEETLFYIVVAPEAYEDGFTVYVRDDYGRVAIQSTYNSGDLYRGVLAQKEPFEFIPSAGPEINVTDASEYMLGYEVNAQRGAYLKTAVILKSAMNQAEEAGMHTFAYEVLCNSGQPAEIAREDWSAFSTWTAYDFGMEQVSIEPDTDYVIVAAYSDSEDVFESTLTCVDAHTGGSYEPSQGGASTEDFVIGEERPWE